MKNFLAITAAVASATPHHETRTFYLFYFIFPVCGSGLIRPTPASPPFFSHTSAPPPPRTAVTFTESEFTHLGPAALTEQVTFHAALPWAPGSVAALDAKLADISAPTSPNYGAWLSGSEVNALTAPLPHLRAAAAKALASAGAKCVDMPHSLKCTAPVAAANALFSTNISAFSQAGSASRVLRVHPNDPYAFPDALRGSVDFVTSLLDFPTSRRKLGRAAAAKPAAADYDILPESLTAIYGTVAAGSMQSTYAPVEFQGDPGWSPEDLSKFATASGLPQWNVSHKIGPYTPNNPDLEATLDVQYMGSIAQGADEWYWTEADWQYEWGSFCAFIFFAFCGL